MKAAIVLILVAALGSVRAEPRKTIMRDLTASVLIAAISFPTFMSFSLHASFRFSHFTSFAYLSSCLVLLGGTPFHTVSHLR